MTTRGGASAVLALAAAALAAPGAAAAETHVAAFSASPRIAVGDRAVVSGRLAPGRPARVLLQRRGADGRWTVVARLRPDRRGRFAATVRLGRSASLRAAVRAPDGRLVPGRRRWVAVARRVTLRVAPRPYESIAGRPLDVRGRVRPARAGERVLLQASAGGPWRPLARLRVGPRGAVAGVVRVPSGGRWRFRLSTGAAARAGLAGGSAATPRLRVFGRLPHRVARGASRYIVQARSEGLLYYYEDGRLKRVLPVVFGKPSTPTPVGTFRVYARTAGPGPAFGPLVLWYHRGYGIHGTNEEHLLALAHRYYSHGCTRNLNTNIRWLWPRVPVGTPVLNLL